MHSNEMIRVCDLVSPRNHLNLFRKTNPISPDQLGDEDQYHKVHNGQTTSYHTHWCISWLSGGEGLKIAPNSATRHK